MEIWKDIKDYEGLYQVSNYGNIKSFKRDKVRINDSAKGYVRITLYKNAKPKHFQVHRLVCDSFTLNPENKKEVNHKNGIKHDNRVENLEWVTRSENLIHAHKVLGFVAYKPMKNKFGYSHNRSKEVTQISKDLKVVSVYGSAGDAERATGISRKNISRCVVGKNKTAGGFIWSTNFF